MKAAPIPTRCYKVLGVTTWTLAFESKPATTRFLCGLNGVSHEIILTPANEKQTPLKQTKKPKGAGKGKSFAKQDSVASTVPSRQTEEVDSTTDSRITALEVKFGSLERRQDSLEHRITDGFLSVNDQLRQVLNHIQPRASHEPTGASPPTKLPKLSS